ncbi:MAG TPA: hypothetical protein PL033_21370 [Candidatus Brocadiia bacterium]|nr:hypothetical protein [Candidatus Brocadiia bacterium]
MSMRKRIAARWSATHAGVLLRWRAFREWLRRRGPAQLAIRWTLIVIIVIFGLFFVLLTIMMASYWMDRSRTGLTGWFSATSSVYTMERPKASLQPRNVYRMRCSLIFDHVSNIDSPIIATDADGIVRWSVSPNFRLIEEVGPVE